MTIKKVKPEDCLLLNGEQVFQIRDDSSELLAYLSLIEGKKLPAFGGIRRRRFTDPLDAMREARALASQMMQKIAFAELPQGAAKVVILDSEGLDLRRAYQALGRAIESLGGRYFAGPDVGTGNEELTWVAEETAHVNHVDNHPGDSTALGVAAGLSAVSRFLRWPDGLRGKSVLIQGLGSVGASLARMLHRKGANLLVLDLDTHKAERLAQELSAPDNPVLVVMAEDFDVTPADVFCPCALGDVLDPNSLRFEVVCGSANLQSDDPQLIEALFDGGCLVIPEVTVNAGAVIEGIIVHSEGNTDSGRKRAQEHILATERRVYDLLQNSAQRRQSLSSTVTQLLPRYQDD